MLSGIIFLWFILTVLSVLFVIIDIHDTPESPVLKWGFILLTLYTGPIGAFLYVLGCREPLPGLHEQYVSTRWRQVLGSTMHCVAGDGLGILVGAIIGSLIHLSQLEDITLEYILGFGFGWTIFQALFMKDSAGGSFTQALKNTFLPELISMNYLMAAMVVVMTIGMHGVPQGNDPTTAAFWFIMSMSLLVGFIFAFPVNWWLVSNHLKHGMMTIRPNHKNHTQTETMQEEPSKHTMGDNTHKVSTSKITLVVLLSILIFTLGVMFALTYKG